MNNMFTRAHSWLKVAKSPTPSATSMTTTRSQSLAMPTPQATSAPPVQESPESIPSQESPLSPGWIHAITIHGPPIDIRARKMNL